jgi:hypothetical protein
MPSVGLLLHIPNDPAKVVYAFFMWSRGHSALLAILGERSSRGAKVLGYFDRRRQSRELIRHDGRA